MPPKRAARAAESEKKEAPAATKRKAPSASEEEEEVAAQPEAAPAVQPRAKRARKASIVEEKTSDVEIEDAETAPKKTAKKAAPRKATVSRAKKAKKAETEKAEVAEGEKAVEGESPAAPSEEGTSAAASPAEGKKEKKPRASRKRAVVDVEEKVFNEWNEVFFAGTEWENYDKIFQIGWDFDHVFNRLFTEQATKDDATLAGKRIYIFGTTEPQMIPRMVDGEEKSEVMPIPALVAIICSRPPPAVLGINSVQMEQETILPMSDLKMDWVPRRTGEKPLPDVYFLECSLRPSSLKRMSEDEKNKFTYCMPHIEREEEALNRTFPTEVSGFHTFEGRPQPVSYEFDWEMDDLKEKVAEIAEDQELTEEQKTELEGVVREAARDLKKKNKEEKEAIQARFAKMSDEERTAMKEMRVLKFYPRFEALDMSPFKNAFVNRYYGRANELI